MPPPSSTCSTWESMSRHNRSKCPICKGSKTYYLVGVPLYDNCPECGEYNNTITHPTNCGLDYLDDLIECLVCRTVVRKGDSYGGCCLAALTMVKVDVE